MTIYIISFSNRFMKALKGHVRNRARPEGCITECYLADECVEFRGTYISQAADTGVKHTRMKIW